MPVRRTAGADAARQPHDIAHLYCTYGPLVHRRAERFLPASEAEEVMHEVFVRALESMPPDDDGVSPVHWLYRVTTNLCLNRLRDARRQATLLARFAPTAWDAIQLPKDTESQVFVRQLWRHLDEELAMIGTYFYVDGLTTAEIGELVGVSDRTVANRLKTLSDVLRREVERAPLESGRAQRGRR